MSCLKFSQNSFLSSSKQKARNADAHGYQPKYFMDGNPTSLSTFELGCDSDSSANSVWNDENSLYGNESILASSQQNSTMNLPTSAPSSIARDKILACSTPKDQLPENKEKAVLELKSPAPASAPAAPVAHDATPFNRTPIPWASRRSNYRNNRMRNMAKPMPGEPMNSYFTKENRPIIEEIHRRQQEQEQNRLRRQQAEARELLLNALKEHIVELVCSVLVFTWQFFFVLNTIPREDPLVYILNIIICMVYGLVFMTTQPTWWKIVGCSFGVYYAFTWLFGASLALGSFAFAAVFAKSMTTVFQIIVSLVC